MIVIGNIYAGLIKPGSSGILTANNGLILSTPTNVQLGGVLIQDTTVDSQGNQLNFESTGGAQLSISSQAPSVQTFQTWTPTAITSFVEDNASGHITGTIINDGAGIELIDQIAGIGATYLADYSAAGISNPAWLASVKGVGLLITAALVGYAKLSGATFTGNISALNLSGTNTGDQNLAPYALLAGAVFTGNISALNLSGTNTGDQNLTLYALLAGAAFTGLITGLKNPTGLTPSTAILLENLNAASAGNAQISSQLEFDAFGWGTTAGTSQLVQFFINLLTVQSTVPTGLVQFQFKIAGGAITTPVSITSAGAINATNFISTSNITCGQGLLLNTTKTSVGGSTSGTANFSMPFTGSAYKKVVVQLTALVGTATFSFSVAFTATPAIVSTNGLAATIVTSLSTTAMTLTGATSTGWIIIEGF